MKLLKLTLAAYAIILAALAIALIWTEDRANCGLTTCKFIETLFICCALALTKEATKIKSEK